MCSGLKLWQEPHLPFGLSPDYRVVCFCLFELILETLHHFWALAAPLWQKLPLLLILLQHMWSSACMLEYAMQTSVRAAGPRAARAFQQVRKPEARVPARAADPSMCEGAKARGWARVERFESNTVVYISASLWIVEVVH